MVLMVCVCGGGGRGRDPGVLSSRALVVPSGVLVQARGMPGKKRGAVDTARRSVAISLTGRSTMFDQPRVGLRGLWRLHLCSQVE